MTILLLALVIVLTACKKDEETATTEAQNDDISLLYGSWQAAAYSIEVDSCSFENWMKLNEDGTMQNYNDCMETTTEGTWEYVGDTFTWTDNLLDVPIPCKVLNLTSTEFKIEYQGVETTYTKQ